MYSFLQTRLKEVDAEHLAELPIALAKSWDMVRPRQVVTSFLDEADFYPYLLTPHPHVAAFGDLLQHLGVLLVPTLTHYSHVLAQSPRRAMAEGPLPAARRRQSCWPHDISSSCCGRNQSLLIALLWLSCTC